MEGIDKINQYAENKKKEEINIESYLKNSIVNFKINNVKVKLYDDNFQLLLKPLNMSVRVEDQKFVGNKSEIIFSPIDLEFNCIKIVPNILVSKINVTGFKLNIHEEDSLKISKMYLYQIKLCLKKQILVSTTIIY